MSAIKPETANRITANILRIVNLQPGCYAFRVNNVGVWDEKKQIYRAGNTQKGIADILCCIRGRFLAIEVKAGKDRLSDYQDIFRQDVTCAKGEYFEARSTDLFKDWFVEKMKQI